MTEKKNPAEKKKRGRKSEYRIEYADQALKLCLLGATDKELAEFFSVSEQTLNKWKKDYPEFLESLKKGKVIADATIAEGLYNRAKGAVINVQQAIKLKDSQFNSEGRKISEEERIEVVDLIQEVPPDTAAGIFWLKNRNPEMWRDKQDGKDGLSPKEQLEIQIKELELKKLQREIDPPAAETPDEDYKVSLKPDEEIPNEPIL